MTTTFAPKNLKATEPSFWLTKRAQTPNANLERFIFCKEAISYEADTAAP
jgi:hypothetical protein